MRGQTAYDKLVRQVALRGGGEAEINQPGEIEETELNGVEEGEERMSKEARDDVGSEGELAPPTLACTNKTSKQSNVKREGRARRNTRAVQRLAYTSYDGQRTQRSPRHQTKE